MNRMQSIVLPTGNHMPMVGLGTSRIEHANFELVLDAALQSGFKMTDCAYVYKNEEYIGDVLEKWFASGKITRDDIFITSKLPPTLMGSKEKVEKAVEKSLKSLKTHYIDLYLIHIPMGLQEQDDVMDVFPRDGDGNPLHSNPDMVATWRAMEELVDQGLVKNIGLSNFNSKQLMKIYNIARHPISNLQCECHLYFQQEGLVTLCKKLGITFTAYAPLSSPICADSRGIMSENKTAMAHSVVSDIARKYNKTPAQVLLRFSTQRGLAVIPKSSSRKHLEENIDVFNFNIESSDMVKLRLLDANIRIFWLESLGSNHPEYPFHEP